jgi:hypothetical protein
MTERRKLRTLIPVAPGRAANAKLLGISPASAYRSPAGWRTLRARWAGAERAPGTTAQRCRRPGRRATGNRSTGHIDSPLRSVHPDIGDLERDGSSSLNSSRPGLSDPARARDIDDGAAVRMAMVLADGRPAPSVCGFGTGVKPPSPRPSPPVRSEGHRGKAATLPKLNVRELRFLSRL